jgi:hypothetical protein
MHVPARSRPAASTLRRASGERVLITASDRRGILADERDRPRILQRCRQFGPSECPDSDLVGELGTGSRELDDSRIPALDKGEQRTRMRREELGHVRNPGCLR